MALLRHQAVPSYVLVTLLAASISCSDAGPNCTDCLEPLVESISDPLPLMGDATGSSPALFIDGAGQSA